MAAPAATALPEGVDWEAGLETLGAIERVEVPDFGEFRQDVSFATYGIESDHASLPAPSCNDNETFLPSISAGRMAFDHVSDVP